MFNNSNGYSLADIAAATGGSQRGNDGFFGNDGWWIILLFMFCGWGNGWGGFGGGNQSGAANGYVLASDFSNVERKIDTVNSGLCDGFYAMNTGMLNGFAGVNNNITQQTIANMQSANGISNQINGIGTQMQQCCCENERLVESSFANLNYNLATLACQGRQATSDAARDIIESNNAGVRSILQFLTEDKIASLQAENQSLKSAASQAEQNAYLIRALSPNPIPAYTVPNPYTAYIAPSCGCNGGAY